ncbi:MAG: hypothetical protein JWR16_1197 [Nevskia sp.]|nr:hypothetical protein [Nevskia sp.]
MPDPERPSSDPASVDPIEAAWWASWHTHADSAARGALVERYLPMVRAIARAVYRTTNPNYVDMRDLQQLGSVGLLEAISRFESGHGVTFQQFAGARIRGAILNGLPNLSELHAQQAFRRRTRKERVESLRSIETHDSQSGAFAAMVELTLGLAIGYMLEGTHLYTDEEGERFNYADSTDVVAAADSFKMLLKELPEGQRKVVEYHYRGGLDFTEIARLMELTKGRISQLHRSALEALRKAYKSRAGVDLRA